MSLQVWLPLIKDISNQGLSGISVTNNGATYNSEGKLGGCYYFNGSSHIRISMPTIMTSIKNSSVCAWIKSTGSVVALGGISNDGNYTNAMITLYTSGWQFAGGSAYKYISGGSIANSGVWHHVCCTVSDTIITTYLDGNQVATNTLTGLGVTVTDITSANFIEIGCDHPGGDEYLTGYVNDFRIYNHALSAKEVKELSKGLVAHYTLGDRYVAENLIINGFGELGSENWESSSNISTTEIPSGDSRIKASFYNGNRTKEYIPINPTHTYTMSGYIKSSGATSGNTYPSIFPYDIDKKFINNYNSTDGFSTTWATTLAQPLKKGDTVVYATDLSSWSTANNNYYYHVAIFGYKDSLGTVYGDFVYTADSPSFGSYSDKSNINKTNNTITLNSPFTGEDRPAGTKICQATEGSTYYYPWGGIALSSISDWTFKTGTFTPYSTGRLKACRYITWSTYQNCYIAGNLLIDNTDTDRTVYDSSGYNYHGTINTAQTISSTTARYSVSTNFNGTDNAIKIPFNAMLGLTAAGKTDYTISVWTYKTAIGSKGYQTILGGPSGFELEARNAAETNPVYVAWNWGKNTGTYEFNKWCLFTFVHTTTDNKIYVNGELASSGSAANVPIGDFFIGSWRDVTSQNYQGKMSDFRIYATALSADDIKELYQTSASIDKSGNMYAYELREV